MCVWSQYLPEERCDWCEGNNYREFKLRGYPGNPWGHLDFTAKHSQLLEMGLEI